VLFSQYSDNRNIYVSFDNVYISLVHELLYSLHFKHLTKLSIGPTLMWPVFFNRHGITHKNLFWCQGNVFLIKWQNLFYLQCFFFLVHFFFLQLNKNVKRDKILTTKKIGCLIPRKHFLDIKNHFCRRFLCEPYAKDNVRSPNRDSFPRTLLDVSSFINKQQQWGSVSSFQWAWSPPKRNESN